MAWSQSEVSERSALMLRVASGLRMDKDALARIACEEMGKPITQARAEVEKCAVLCEWYAEHGGAFLERQPTEVGSDAYISYLPLGPVLAVMPWNFPYWQIMRGTVPILFGGNAYVLKHAPNVMGCAYALEQIWRRAGLPSGAFSVVNVTADLVSVAIADSRIAAVAVTASGRAGAAIAAQAGANLKKTVLELGGSDPFVVLAGADIDKAVVAAVLGRFQNTGQVCIATKRIILEAPIAEEFTIKYLAAVKSLRVGDPADENTFIGPMARHDLRDELDNLVRATVSEGAKVLLGGHALEGAGNFYAPTVLGGVQPGMTAFKKETFGPVVTLTTAHDCTHALELANDSDYGLSASLWTGDKEAAKRLVSQIQAGSVFINGFPASDPRVPIGGVKKSGYGRELSYFGVHEFMNAQVVWIDRPVGELPM
ncbi:NAD-dependent succinate-semialdehyde dehydrogenase [Variovorax paradoxus]